MQRSALLSAKELGAFIGGFHPLQMFTDPDVALSGLPGCSVGIEPEEALLEKLKALARNIGCVPMALPAGIRPLSHASACYGAPFLIALFDVRFSGLPRPAAFTRKQGPRWQRCRGQVTIPIIDWLLMTHLKTRRQG